jgi:hypothetical protein
MINDNLAKIKDYPGAMSTYTAQSNRCFFSTSHS